MSRLLGEALTPTILKKLGWRPDTFGKAILLVTVDEAGFPHTAVLSYREVAAKDPATIRFCTLAASRTAQNLRQRRKATLLLIDEGPAYSIKGEAQELPTPLQSFPGLVAFALTVKEVLEDEEPNIPITSGVRFQPPEKPDSLERGKAIQQELLAL
ncbi:MAG: pyridoxamine 5'-phosphate oxidase family protein [candidate division NC10 bacterium]|nr:pyridoxamine 5'-phosphate oxidase family protein [candidate division NC10 bacterium]